MRLLVALALVVMVFAPTPASAQSYRPTYANPNGRELIAVYFGASTCGPCRTPEMPPALDSMKVLLQRRAEAAGRQFRAVIVALDWAPDSGYAFAQEDGVWDEVNTGRNWFGLGAAQWIWADSTVTPSLPQVVVYEQDITMGARVEMGTPRVLRRIHGAAEIQRWVRQGAPTS